MIGKIEKVPNICSLYPQRKRAFGATNLNVIFTLVDASHEINNYTMIQTGGAMSMVLGFTHFRPRKQKLNNKSLQRQS